ncbi:hypothetical protein B0H65DRAFT_313774 [Neurospora tetraspora]|uniref:CoxI translation protein CYA5 n=1 Tax=Neurospora tetraspora TaxID=94610 RepID=A0AAE0J7W4_9PEZI|nr:hypothetical protein B0H65DRAFT_313774 [Neurospora tetraspora]
MLERTAASLETCSLQRVLPVARTSLKSQRQLHTAFWQHGASELELLDAYQALLRDSTLAPTPTQTPSSSQTMRLESKIEPMKASMFLLDFLYPSGTAALLRKILPIRLPSLEPAHKTRRNATRLYSSAINNSSGAAQKPQNEPLEDDSFMNADLFEQYWNEQESGVIQDRRPQKVSRKSGPRALRELLEPSEFGPMHEQIWTAYNKLEPNEQEGFKGEVMANFSQSGRSVDAWRIRELFATVPVERWTEPIIKAAIKAEFVLDDVDNAKILFADALKKRGLHQGLDDVMAHAFNTSSWQLALDIWKLFTSFKDSEKLTVEFKTLASVPGFRDKLAEFVEFVAPKAPAKKASKPAKTKSAKTKSLADTESTPNPVLAVDTEIADFVRVLATKSLRLFSPTDAVVLLRHAADSSAYEAFIKLAIEQGKTRAAAEAYKKYRQLPKAEVRIWVLRAMLDIFYPTDAGGMELVLKDWYSRYDALEKRVYQKFLAFYAGRGDTKSVTRLANEYRKHLPAEAARDMSLISSLMHVHARNGNPEAARKVLENCLEQAGMGKPKTVHWNILLNAYAKASDYSGCLEAFERLDEVGKPDSYSYGTVMGMAAVRGDLSFALVLFNAAKADGIKPDVGMVDSLIEAYCQNDRFREAEVIVKQTVKKGTLPGKYTVLFNTLLNHHARRRDLKGLYNLVEYMHENKIPSDNETYSHLLYGLMYCRQSHHALNLLRASEKDNLFKPAPEHYVLLMASFIHSREPHMALKLNEILSKRQEPEMAERTTRVIDALGRWQQLPGHQRWQKDQKYYITKAINLFKQTLKKTGKGQHEAPRPVVNQFAHILFILTQIRDFGTLEEIMELYTTQFPSAKEPSNLPIRLLNNMMLADYHERKFDRVREIWNHILRKTTLQAFGEVAEEPRETGAEGAETPAQHLVGPYKWILCDPIKTMQRVFYDENDADGLIEFVKDVRNRGFELDSKNWNYYVQSLARMNRYREAFGECEARLMPNWTGWYRVRARSAVKNQLPLELRRLGSFPQRPRPISHTLIIMAKKYMDLENLANWQREAAKQLEWVNAECPLTIKAVKTMIRADSELEKSVFNETEDVLTEEGGYAERDDREENWSEMTEEEMRETAKREQAFAKQLTSKRVV